MTALALTATPVRGHTFADGRLLVVGKDLGPVLDIANIAQAIRAHVDPEDRITAGEMRVPQNSTPADQQFLDALDPQTVLLTEEGVYALIHSVRTTEATRPLKRRVTHEILPALRRGEIVANRDLDPLDVAQQMLTVLLAQREETRALAAEQDRLRWSQRALTARVLDVETRQAAIESRHDWFVALAYAKREGHPTARQYLAKVGAKASVIGRAAGLPDVYTQDDRHGQVRSWPSWVWDQAFSEVAA